MIIKKSELKLVREDDPILHRTPDLYSFDGNDEMFANVMLEKMSDYKGVGLSANQVGINARMFVMGIGDVKMAVFNPEIIQSSSRYIAMDEGCLSFPGIYTKISRPESIHVKYQNVKGEWVEQELTGLTARIFLHEYDHMMGKTMRDVVSKLKWDLAYNRMQKRNKKIIRQGVQRTLQKISNEIKEQK